MWIIAIGWIYVVVLMAATEPTLFAGIITFFGYCVLPLSIVFYLSGARQRRARGEMAARASTPPKAAEGDANDSAGSGTAD
ncbi:hypothetical protein [Massilia horti]|uniref:hypothetical protein n=1 Tax=Massilia horti TaxID=2562153 RepID=UPI00197E7EEB|nr:hypothetical protein [Massilia horti]